jgi:hypothetical protein
MAAGRPSCRHIAALLDLNKENLKDRNKIQVKALNYISGRDTLHFLRGRCHLSTYGSRDLAVAGMTVRQEPLMANARMFIEYQSFVRQFGSHHLLYPQRLNTQYWTLNT